MNISHNRLLYDKLFHQIARMHDEVNYRRRLNAYRGRGGRWKDYPCVSVGAIVDFAGAIGHHHYYSKQEDLHSLLFRELTARLGRLNDNSTNYPMCRNKVGHCAENYAASEVLNILDPDSNFNNAHILSTIQFTKAFRPRTWKNINWCANCNTMFD